MCKIEISYLPVCQYVHVHLTCAVPQNARRRCQITGTGATFNCEPPSACWESNLGHLEECPVLFWCCFWDRVSLAVYEDSRRSPASTSIKGVFLHTQLQRYLIYFILHRWVFGLHVHIQWGCWELNQVLRKSDRLLLTTEASPVLAALFKNKEIFRSQLPLLKVESALSELR